MARADHRSISPPLHPVAAWIVTQAPPGTAVAAGPILDAKTFDTIQAAATAYAAKPRRDEFHTGRALARAALAQLDCKPAAIPVGQDRAPVWPTGFIGT